jgi:hypothetical protein
MGQQKASNWKVPYSLCDDARSYQFVKTITKYAIGRRGVRRVNKLFDVFTRQSAGRRDASEKKTTGSVQECWINRIDQIRRRQNDDLESDSVRSGTGGRSVCLLETHVCLAPQFIQPG